MMAVGVKICIGGDCARVAEVEEYDPQATHGAWKIGSLCVYHVVKTPFVSVNGINKNWPWVLPVGL